MHLFPDSLPRRDRERLSGPPPAGIKGTEPTDEGKVVGLSSKVWSSKIARGLSSTHGAIKLDQSKGRGLNTCPDQEGGGGHMTDQLIWNQVL